MNRKDAGKIGRMLQGPQPFLSQLTRERESQLWPSLNTNWCHGGGGQVVAQLPEVAVAPAQHMACGLLQSTEVLPARADATRARKLLKKPGHGKVIAARVTTFSFFLREWVEWPWAPEEAMLSV